MWKRSQKFIKEINKQDWAKKLPVEEDFWNLLMEWISDNILPEFLTQLSHQVNEIIEINPDLSEPEILALVTKYMVGFLDARSASVRIYDPFTEQMLSYGSYPSEEEEYRETHIPLEKSIAGEVAKTRRPYMVPNILKEDLYQDKDVIVRKGSYSMMAIPLEIPRFAPYERDTVGVIQIYYPEKDRTFTHLEVLMAELMSRRLSFVIAHKKILSMLRTREKKDVIVRRIFQKLGAQEGVKMMDVFNRVIPELVDIINLQSCALFSVAEDLEHIFLEAGYPDSVEHYGIGKRFSISSEPAFEIVLNLRDYTQESPYEVVTQSYVLVMDPQKSELVSKKVKQYAFEHNINSILYVPLNEGEEIPHFMTFDALDQRQRYTAEEIEIFLFLGRELMKAQRMERLDDILHDFKNPAIATAGFARRLKALLETVEFKKEDAKIQTYVDILLKETSRMQEMALSLSQVGNEQIVNLTEVLQSRFEINR
jgi:GAF domain-containing protein